MCPDSDEVYTFSTSSKEVQGDDIILDEDNAHVEGGERLVSVEIDVNIYLYYVCFILEFRCLERGQYHTFL